MCLKSGFIQPCLMLLQSAKTGNLPQHSLYSFV
jgi:hypothetical protein